MIGIGGYDDFIISSDNLGGVEVMVFVSDSILFTLLLLSSLFLLFILSFLRPLNIPLRYVHNPMQGSGHGQWYEKQS